MSKIDFIGMADEEFNTANFSEQETVKAQQEDSDVPDEQEEVDYSDHEDNYDDDYNDDNSSDENDDKYAEDDILRPLTLDGKDFEVRNADEARRLMQMGLSYSHVSKKLRQNQGFISTLEKEKLLDEDKLNFLIDLSKGNKDAIAKLIKDHNYESSYDDYDDEKTSNYVPNNYQVPQQTLALQSVLDSLQHTPTYNNLLDVVGNKWDERSREEFGKNPELFDQLNQQMGLGIYDLIQNEVERMRVFGAFSGMSDFQAYQQMGSDMYQRGEFNNIINRNSSHKKQQQAHTQQQNEKNGSLNDVIERRRRASNPVENRAPSAQHGNQEVDFMSMSDEEFLKYYRNA